MPVRYSAEFGDAVREALGSRSYRQIAAKAEISASYIGDMVQGRVPSREVIVSFARGAGLDANPLLALVGYRLQPEAPGNESQLQRLHRLRDAFAAYCARLGAGEPAIPFASEGEDLTDADDILRSVVESHAEDYPQFAKEFADWLFIASDLEAGRRE